MKLLARCLVLFSGLFLAAPERALAAPPPSCVGKFVGTWTVTILATGQTYRSQIRADGTLTSFCPLCPPGQNWTCNGNTFILTSPVSLTQTLSADGRRMGGGCCSATRIGGAPTLAKPAPTKQDALPKRPGEAPVKTAKAAPPPGPPGQSGARPSQPPAPAPSVADYYLIFFDRSRAELGEMAQVIVDDVANDFRSIGPASIHINGHSDAEPIEAKNDGLAQARADAVRAALVAKGIPTGAIKTLAAGSSMPLVQAPDGEPEPQNRRVEIMLKKEEPARNFLIFFNRSRAEVGEVAQQIIDDVMDGFRSTGAKGIRIVGHSDAEPVEGKNDGLAQARADAVRAALVARGVPVGAIAAVAAGSSMPLVQAPDGEPEPQNRRVEIMLSR